MYINLVLYCYACVRSHFRQVKVKTQWDRLHIGCMRCRRQLAGPKTLAEHKGEIREGFLEVFIEQEN